MIFSARSEFWPIILGAPHSLVCRSLTLTGNGDGDIVKPREAAAPRRLWQGCRAGGRWRASIEPRDISVSRVIFRPPAQLLHHASRLSEPHGGRALRAAVQDQRLHRDQGEARLHRVEGVRRRWTRLANRIPPKGKGPE